MLLQVVVLVDRLHARAVGPGSGVALSAYTLIVDTNTQCASGQAATALRTCDGMPRHVDHRVEVLGREVGRYVVGAVPHHVPGAVGYVADSGRASRT